LIVSRFCEKGFNIKGFGDQCPLFCKRFGCAPNPDESGDFSCYPSCKTIAVKKSAVIRLPWPPKPDGTDADKELLFFYRYLSAGGTAGRNQTEEPLELLSKKIDLS